MKMKQIEQMIVSLEVGQCTGFRYDGASFCEVTREKNAYLVEITGIDNFGKVYHRGSEYFECVYSTSGAVGMLPEIEPA